MKRIFAALTALAMAVVGTVLLSGPASASGVVTSSCSSSAQMCLYYNSIGYGLNAEFGGWAYDGEGIISFNPNYGSHTTYEFKAGPHGSSGAGWGVWNEAAAAHDFHPYYYFSVWYNTDYQGPADEVAPGQTRNLSNTYNNDASVGWS